MLPKVKFPATSFEIEIAPDISVGSTPVPVIEADLLVDALTAWDLELVRHVRGAMEAALSDSVDRWVHGAASLRLVINTTIDHIAPKNAGRVIRWVRDNYPHECLRRVPTVRGRLLYALRFVKNVSGSLDRIDSIVDARTHENEILHKPNQGCGDLVPVVIDLYECLTWLLVNAKP